MPTVDTLHHLSRGSHGRPPDPPTVSALATHHRPHTEEPLAPGTTPRPRLPPPPRRETGAPHPPTAGTSRRARPMDVHPPGRPRYCSLQRGTKHTTAMHSAPPSVAPHGGCGPRMTPRHQPPCPGGQPMLKPGACITAQRGESLLVSLLLVYCSLCTCLLCLLFAQ